ncbi:MAG: hypothetical protein SVT52_04920 [Planctomycetota bacterium]|nr:hypothetical protein [Planctomycetota bacterium]
MNTNRMYVAAVVVLCLLPAGCFKMDVNLDTPNGGSDGKGTSAPPQLPAAGGGDWKDILAGTAGHIFLATEHGVLFYAFDTLAYPKAPVDLAARVQSGRNLKGMEGVEVAFYRGRLLLGLAMTDQSGLAVAEWTPPAAGNYELTVKIVAVPDEVDDVILKVTPAPLLVAARDKNTSFAIIDLDHTVVESSFFRVLVGGAKPMTDSARVAKLIARRYGLIYLTHRPDLLTRKSKLWLQDNGYPRGPLLVSELKQAFGDSGKFKTTKLKDIRKAFPGVRIGIGDKLSDAQAYVDNGMKAYLIPHYKQKPKDMRKMAGEIRRLRGRGRLQVVENWQQIEAGVSRGRKFPPATFARKLDVKAKRLEAKEKARKNKKDDDDDDDD